MFASCFDANAGLFEILLTPQDAVLSDELNHASIIDGIRLCKARKARYQHRDMQGKDYLMKMSIVIFDLLRAHVLNICKLINIRFVFIVKQ